MMQVSEFHIIMFEDKLPSSFDGNIECLDIEKHLCNRIPSFEEMSHIVNFFISIRNKYCPPINYDVSARASRGIFVGIPDSGIEAFSILSNSGICEVFMCTYTPERRTRIFKNCGILGIDNRIKVCSLSFYDALMDWYPHNSVMTPVFLDLSESAEAVNLYIQDEISISFDGHGLNEVLQLCWKQHVPFVCIRIKTNNVGLLRTYVSDLRAFQEDSSFSDTYSYVALVPQVYKLDRGSLVYPGEEQLPTILSGNQLKTIWARGGELKKRTERWIHKVIVPSDKAEKALEIINNMVNSDSTNDNQDYSIYSALYHMLFPAVEKDETINVATLEATPTPIISSKEENAESVESVLDVNTPTQMNDYRANGRANSRVKDFRILLPQEVRQRPIQSYCDIGCADGSITVAIGESLHLSSRDIFGCDVRDIPTDDNLFQFKYYDGLKLPYVNNSFDLITVYMVMHHIPKIDVFIEELYRVLKSKGHLIIREHDCDPDELRLFLDVEHGLYALVLSQDIETPDFCTTFQTFYRSRNEWRKMLTDVGFTEVTCDDVAQEHRRDFRRLTEGTADDRRAGVMRNMLNSFYAVFVKDGGNKMKSQRDQGHQRQTWGRDRDRDRDPGSRKDRDRYNYGARYRDRSRSRDWDTKSGRFYNRNGDYKGSVDNDRYRDYKGRRNSVERERSYFRR